MNDTLTTPDPPVAETPPPAAPEAEVLAAANGRPRRRYTDEDRATAMAALQANNGDVRHTSRQLGVPRATLQGWAGGSPPVPPAVQERKSGELALTLESVAFRMAGVIESKADRIDPKAAAVIIGICVDKLLLLQNRPNSITRTQTAAGPDLSGMSDAELAEHIARLKAEAEAVGAAVNPDEPDEANDPAEPAPGTG